MIGKELLVVSMSRTTASAACWPDSHSHSFFHLTGHGLDRFRMQGKIPRLPYVTELRNN